MYTLALFIMVFRLLALEFPFVYITSRSDLLEASPIILSNIYHAVTGLEITVQSLIE